MYQYFFSKLARKKKKMAIRFGRFEWGLLLFSFRSCKKSSVTKSSGFFFSKNCFDPANKNVQLEIFSLYLQTAFKLMSSWSSQVIEMPHRPALPISANISRDRNGLLVILFPSRAIILRERTKNFSLHPRSSEPRSRHRRNFRRRS